MHCNGSLILIKTQWHCFHIIHRLKKWLCCVLTEAAYCCEPPDLQNEAWWERLKWLHRTPHGGGFHFRFSFFSRTERDKLFSELCRVWGRLDTIDQTMLPQYCQLVLWYVRTFWLVWKTEQNNVQRSETVCYIDMNRQANLLVESAGVFPAGHSYKPSFPRQSSLSQLGKAKLASNLESFFSFSQPLFWSRHAIFVFCQSRVHNILNAFMMKNGIEPPTHNWE